MEDNDYYLETIKAKEHSDEVPSEYDKDYEMRGRAIIVNLYETHVTVQERVKMCYNKDVDELRRTFGILQFQVHVLKTEKIENKAEFVKYLEEVAKDEDHRKSECFVLVVLGLESRRGVIRAWDTDMEVQEIWKCFTADKCPLLARKPKLFFFQAFWRIEAVDTTNRHEGDKLKPITAKKYSIPVEADILIAYPTVEDVDTMREKFKGSPFVSSLCSVLREDFRRHEKEPVQKLMTYLCKELNSHRTRVEVTGAVIKQFPTVASTFLSLMYLKRKFAGESEFEDEIELERNLAKAKEKNKQTKMDSREYETTLEFRGKAVIANFFTAQREDDPNRVEKRDGSKMDVKRLEATFRALQFDVDVWDEENEMTKDYFLKRLRNVAREDHSKSECLVLVVMCHGSNNGNLRAFDKEFHVREVWECFTADNCPSLEGKPKMLFFQACRGSGFSQEVNAFMGKDDIPAENHWVPGETDILIAYPTFIDNFSLRDPTKGSPFINALCDVLDGNWKEAEKEPLQTLMTSVCRKVASQRWASNKVTKDESMEVIIKQLPTVVSTLTNLVYFKRKFV